MAGKSRWVFVALVACVASALIVCDESTQGGSSPEPVATQALSEPGVAEGEPGVAARAGGEEGVGIDSKARVVTLGGAITEVVFELGRGEQVVGVDVTSTWPEEVGQLPRVGYYRKLSAEGILALRPDHILVLEDAGPAQVLEQIEGAGVTIHRLPSRESLEVVPERIEKIGELLGESDEARGLIAEVEQDMERVRARREEVADEDRPKVLFIYARGANVLMVAGEGTSAEAMLEAAGAQNAVTGFEGFKPLTPEAVIAAKPEYIVAPSAGAESIGGIEGVLGLPGVAQTPAGEQRRVVTVDDARLLGFGPRAGRGLLEMQDGLGFPEAP